MLPLAGAPRLTMLGREVRLGLGAADLLAVESSGRLVVIEVKLAGNAESRRAVVAQVLSYAGYLQGLDVGGVVTNWPAAACEAPLNASVNFTPGNPDGLCGRRTNNSAVYEGLPLGGPCRRTLALICTASG